MLWLIILLLGFMSWGLSEVVRRRAINKDLLVMPNHRSSHMVPTPTGGGLAFVITFLIAICAFVCIVPSAHVLSMLVMAFAATGIAVIGYIDDHKHIAARYRLCVHFLAAIGLLLVIPSTPGLPLPFGVLESSFLLPVYVLGLVWLLNLYNFMDGIDGIAGVEAVTTTISASILAAYSDSYEWAWSLIGLASCVLGFLVMNWPPAKIFMGDVGSGFLGFILGAMALLTASQDVISLWSWLILLAYFIVDASVTLFKRLIRGEVVYDAHRSHAYQILSRRTQSHKKVTLVVLIINTCWLFPLSFLANEYYLGGVWFFVLAYFPLALFVLRVGAGTTNN